MDTTQKTLQKFLNTFPSKEYEKGEILLFQGEVPKNAFIIKQGIVKAYNLTAQGDEKPIAFNVALDVLPAHWVFDKTPSSLYFYEAFTPVEIYSVPKDEYIAFIKSDSAVMFNELEKSVTNYTGKTMRLNALQYSKASDKIIYTLHYLTLTFGRKVKDDLVEINLPLNHQDFANLTGLTRETTAVELHKLKKQGIIAYEKHVPYQVWLSRLNTLLSDQFLADLQITL